MHSAVMNLSAAILAGGLARRLGGQDKSALIVDGARLLDRQRAALRPLTSDIVLIGYRGETPAPLPVEPDRWPGTGALGGLVTALTAAHSERVLILASDLPFITAPFLAFLAAIDPAADAVVPVADGRWQPLCAVYATRTAERLRSLLERGDRAVIEAVATLKPRLVGPEALAPFDSAGRLLANINTPDDLARCSRANAADRTAPPGASQTTTR